MAIFHQEDFNQPSGNVLLNNKTPNVGGSWALYQGGEVYACSNAHPETDARLRGISVASGVATYVSAANDPGGEYYIQCDVGTRSVNGGYVGVISRVNTSTNTYYRIYVNADTVYLDKFTGGSPVNLASASWGWSGNFFRTLRAVFDPVGKTITIYNNGVQKLQYTDASFISSPGKVGIFAVGTGGNAVVFDNFEAGTTSAIAPTTASATGLSTADAVGRQIKPSAFNEAGSAVSSVVGTALVRREGDATAAGTSDMFGQSFAFLTGYGQSEGHGVAQGATVVFYENIADGSASGSSDATAQGSGRFFGTFSSAGSSTAAADGSKSIGKDEGWAITAGTSSADAVGVRLELAVATFSVASLGEGTAEGVRVITIEADATAAGVASSDFYKWGRFFPADGTAAGTSVAKSIPNAPIEAEFHEGGLGEGVFGGRSTAEAFYEVGSGGSTTTDVIATQIFEAAGSISGLASGVFVSIPPLGLAHTIPAERIFTVLTQLPRVYVLEGIFLRQITLAAEPARTFVVPAEEARIYIA